MFLATLGSTLSEDLLNGGESAAPVDIRVIPASPSIGGGGKKSLPKFKTFWDIVNSYQHFNVKVEFVEIQ